MATSNPGPGVSSYVNEMQLRSTYDINGKLLQILGPGQTVAYDPSNVAITGGVVSSNITGQGVKVALFGDSITRYNNVYGADTTSFNTPIGYWTWANILTNHRFSFTPASNFGISGNKTSDMLARIGTVVSAAPDYVIVLGGINDVLGSIAPATTIANLTSIITTLTNAGVKVILGTVWPNNNLSTAAIRQAWLEVNTWIRRVAPTFRGVVLWDSLQNLADQNSTTFGMVASYTVDGTHPNKIGAYWAGKALADLLNQVLPNGVVQYAAMGIADTFDAVNSPHGNYLGAAGSFQGVGGTKGTGITGTVASGWDVSRNAGSTIVCTASIEATALPNGQTINRQVLTISSPGAGANNEEIILNSLTSNFISGDTVLFGCDVDVGAPTRVVQVAGRIQRQYGDYSATVDGFDPGGAFAPVAFTGHLLSPPLFLNGTGTACLPIISIILDCTAAASVTVKVGRAYVRRLT